jgi:hypothetical protein
MNPNMIAWFEILFNVTYLTAVWAIVALMTRSMAAVTPENRRVAGLVRLAFVLLAAGDTAHVGFRVIAGLLGGEGAQVNVFGAPMSLIGLGTMATSFTVTLFYMLFVYVWQARYNRPANWFTNLLLAAGVLRLMMMALPANDWGSLAPPYPMSLYRNLPLIVQGVGVIGLILYSATRARDTLFQWIGALMAVSYAFYIPVILFARLEPLLGLLMIPKTCAYLAVAWLAYRGLWPRSHATLRRATA